MSDPEAASVPAPIIVGADLVEVDLASGSTIKVHADEADWFNATRDEYLTQAKFTERTDLQDLDRLLALELAVYRSTQHMASGLDYEGLLVDEAKLQRDIKLMSDQITKVKASMGLSKAARDAAANEGSLAQYLADLKVRAKAFGVHREEQLGLALALLKEIFAHSGAWLRSDAEERQKLGFEHAEDVLKWIMDDARERFEAHDAHFRENEQRYWVRDL